MAGGRASRPDEMEAHPGLAPGSSVLRTDGSTTLPCARLKMGRPTGAAPAQRPSQGRMLAVTSRPPSKVDPPAGAAPAWSALRVRCIAGLCHGGIEKWRSREDSHLEPPPSQGGVQALLHLGSEYPRQESHLRRELRRLAFSLLNYGDIEMVRHAGAAPALAVWKTAVLAVTPMTRKSGGCCRYRAGLSSSSARR